MSNQYSWQQIILKPMSQAVAYLESKGYEVMQSRNPRHSFACAETGDLYVTIARLTQTKERTRVHMFQGYSFQDLRFAATGLYIVEEKLRWDARRKTINFYPNPKQGLPYRSAYICRPLGDDDLSLEAFEATLEPSTHTRASEHTQRVTGRRVSFPG